MSEDGSEWKWDRFRGAQGVLVGGGKRYQSVMALHLMLFIRVGYGVG